MDLVRRAGRVDHRLRSPTQVGLRAAWRRLRTGLSMSLLSDPPETLLRLAAAGEAPRRWVLFIGARWSERRPLADAGASGFGWHVSYLDDVVTALPVCRQIAFDAVVLDHAELVPPAAPAWTRLREALRCPLLVSSERPDETDEITVLEQGADDFIGWPIAARRLHARLTAACRGRGPAAAYVDPPNDGTGPGAAGWWLDAPYRALRRGLEKIDLTPVQQALLGALMSRPGRVHGCAELVLHARHCGADPCASEIRIHIHRLRQRLRTAGVHELQIESVRGRGYALRQAVRRPPVTRTCSED